MKKSRCTHYEIPFFVIFALIFLLLTGIFLYIIWGNPQKAYDAVLTQSDMPTVIIDAGHGGEDGGAVGIDKSVEKDINLSIAQKLKKYLEECGIKCILTRSEDLLLYDRNTDYQGRKKILDMQARLKIVNETENAVFISIHQNSFPQEKYSGTQIYYSPNDTRSRELALAIESRIKSELQPQNNRHSKASGGKIFLLDNLSCPAILIECGFLSNAEECKLLSSEEYQSRLCQAIAKTVNEFLCAQ